MSGSWSVSVSNPTTDTHPIKLNVAGDEGKMMVLGLNREAADELARAMLIAGWRVEHPLSSPPAMFMVQSNAEQLHLPGQN